jgi:hypothetical protein
MVLRSSRGVHLGKHRFLRGKAGFVKTASAFSAEPQCENKAR